jgi:hypothetical protein
LLLSREFEAHRCALTGNPRLSPLSQHRAQSFHDIGAEGVMIAKDLIIAKDRCTYTIRILRQEQNLRDHVPNPAD